MKFKKILILTSKSSWFIPYANKLKTTLQKKGYITHLLNSNDCVDTSYDVVFLLSYFNLVDTEFLSKTKYNMVVHESDLPNGKGWAPLAWQILEGCNTIPVCMFNADEKVDGGEVFLKDEIELIGVELYPELRELQAHKTIEMCIHFLDFFSDLSPQNQTGDETYYQKRTKVDSELNIDKTIREQFNLLRTVDNEDFPAFFYMNGIKFILKIEGLNHRADR